MRLFRMPLTGFVQKQLHTLHIHLWQDQRVKLSRDDVRSRIGVGVFMTQSMAWHTGRTGLGGPTAAHAVDASKASLILEHQLDRALPWPVRAGAGKSSGQFFFHASCTWLSLWG